MMYLTLPLRGKSGLPNLEILFGAGPLVENSSVSRQIKMYVILSSLVCRILEGFPLQPEIRMQNL